MMRVVTEAERVDALHRLRILDTGPEPHFDAVCAVARDLFQVSTVLVSLIDEDRQWFKARCGLDAQSTPRELAFCRFTIESDEVLAVEDARQDRRFASNPFVTGEPHIRFYAGAPLIYAPGLRLGTVCLIGDRPRAFTEGERKALENLAAIVVGHLRLHEANVRLCAELEEKRAREALIDDQLRELRRRETLLAQTEQLANLGVWQLDFETQGIVASDNLRRIFERPEGEPGTLDNALSAYRPEDKDRLQQCLARLKEANEPFDLTVPITRGSGEQRTIRLVGAPDIVDGRTVRAFGIVHDITDFTKAMMEAREANRLLLMAEQEAHVGHWRMERQSERVTWSAEVFKIYGIDPADGPPPTAEARQAFYHPEDRARIARIAFESWALGRDHEFEARIVRPDGEIRTVFARSIGERDATGEIAAVFGVVMDITDQKRIEAELRQNTALLEATLENMDQGLMMVDADDRVQVINRRALELLDLPAEFMAGKPTQREVRDYQIAAGEFLSDDPAIRSWANDARLQTDKPVYERQRPNGTVLEIRTVALPDGRAVRTYTDITARRRAEAARAETEARYRLLAEHSRDLIILGHNDGRRSYISPAVRTMLGYTVEEAHRLRMRDFVHPDDLPQVFELTRGLSLEAPHGSVLYRLRHKDGRYIWAEAVFQRVETDGDVTIITAIRDVTERQGQAEELRRAKESAEEARHRAERANEAKTEFLASMSHEIRTPLNGILGYADLLIGASGLAPEQRRHVERVRSAGSALLTVVDDILDFSKIEAGQVDLDAAPFSPRVLVEDAVAIVRSVAHAKGLPIRVELDPDLPEALLGDEARLRQILLNLLNNAVKFTRVGHVAVRVRREAAGPEGERVTFQIADTGIGIPHEKRERLFKRFSQVDGSIRREFGGTGLGLAISKQLVEMMGGTIAVDSMPGEGSTFSFAVTLLCAEAHAVEAAAGIPAATPSQAARVLLVEDLDINQELARAVLEAAGYRVDVAQDGSEAVAAVQATAYDAVLMDVQMPGMDGLTATRLIRALDHPACRVPIVAMTANVLPQQVNACRDAGMTDHVGKPFKRDELYAALDRALARVTVGPVAPKAPASLPPVLDEAVLAGLIDITGPGMAQRLLDQFAADFGTRFAPAGEEGRGGGRSRIARDAHAVVSSAGILGFMRLSQACAELERACEGRSSLDGDLARVRGLGLEAIAAARTWAKGRSLAVAEAG